MSALNELKPTENEYFEIQSALKEILGFCGKYGICEGEARQLIHKEFGKLERIDSSKFTEIKIWFNHNWHRKIQILDPPLHENLMKSNDDAYAKFFSANETRNTQKQSFLGQE